MGSPSEEFGPYTVYEQIGLGGMATVHRAETKGISGFSKQVALKRMLPGVAADASLVQSFIREARLASQLRHVNVAQTYDLGKVGDTYFIAMELVPGRNLREILKHCAAVVGHMPLPIAMNIVTQICDALDYAHNLCDESGHPLGIIHRDVSPSNIIVSESGVVKLIDFGIAKATAKGLQTQSGTLKGKFGYMAPEYLMGSIDARADLFALGIIAHELLSNRPLFQGKDDMDTLYRVKDMEILPPSRFNALVPKELEAVVMTALQRDPEQRWQRAHAMFMALATETKRLNMVTPNSGVVEWIEWAFSQTTRPVIEESQPLISVSRGTMEVTRDAVKRATVPDEFSRSNFETVVKAPSPKDLLETARAPGNVDWNAGAATTPASASIEERLGNASKLLRPDSDPAERPCSRHIIQRNTPRTLATPRDDQAEALPPPPKRPSAPEVQPRSQRPSAPGIRPDPAGKSERPDRSSQSPPLPAGASARPNRPSAPDLELDQQHTIADPAGASARPGRPSQPPLPGASTRPNRPSAPDLELDQQQTIADPAGPSARRDRPSQPPLPSASDLELDQQHTQIDDPAGASARRDRPSRPPGFPSGASARPDRPSQPPPLPAGARPDRPSQPPPLPAGARPNRPSAHDLQPDQQRTLVADPVGASARADRPSQPPPPLPGGAAARPNRPSAPDLRPDQQRTLVADPAGASARPDRPSQPPSNKASAFYVAQSGEPASPLAPALNRTLSGQGAMATPPPRPTPSPTQPPLRNTPSPTQPPLRNTPSPTQPPLRNTPSPTQPPLRNTPSPTQPPLRNTPAPAPAAGGAQPRAPSRPSRPSNPPLDDLSARRERPAANQLPASKTQGEPAKRGGAENFLLSLLVLIAAGLAAGVVYFALPYLA